MHCLSRSLFAGALSLMAAATLSISADAEASELTLRDGKTGYWYDQGFESQGVQIEVVGSDTAVVAWYTYGTLGEPLWLIGVGEIDGSRIRADLLQLDGGVFPGLDAEGQDVIEQG